MTDLELLELAAKAAGLNVKAHRVDSDDKFTHLIVGKKNTRERVLWNPLTEDGDAFRLAVKLGISAGPSFAGNKAVAFVVSTGHVVDFPYVEVPYGDDRNYSTRLAIVRAAAEIGKQLQN